MKPRRLRPSQSRSRHDPRNFQLDEWWGVPPTASRTGQREIHRFSRPRVHQQARSCSGDWADALRLAADMSFVEVKCRDVGVHETEVDVARVAERCLASGDAVLSRRFSDLARALVRESHWLRVSPEAAPALIWNRLRGAGWSPQELDGQLRIPSDTSFLRVRYAVTRESPALVRDLAGHFGPVVACAVTPDGRRVVSASRDQTLKVWDLERASARHCEGPRRLGDGVRGDAGRPARGLGVR
jgi:hypothetical protein